MSKPKVAIVDKDDNVIGAMSKEEALRTGKTRRISRIFLINEDRVFLQKRGPNQDPFPNRWDQSAGGHVDEGEIYLQAAIRELEEELGIKNVAMKEIGKFFFEGYLAGGQKTSLFNTIFIAKYDGQPIKLQESEVTEGQWVPLIEISGMIKANPDNFTLGFVTTWDKFKDRIIEISIL